MSRVIPTDYISTDDAINEILNADEHWRMAFSVWEGAVGRTKNEAYGAVCEAQEALTIPLASAVASGRIRALALKRTGAGDWSELQLPRDYWEGMSGELALFKGNVVGSGLPIGDQWVDGLPLCFRRTDWDAWMGRRNSNAPASADEASATTKIGRPLKWDWWGAAAEATRIANLPDGLPEKQGDLEAAIAQWFIKTTGDQPSVSQIREKIGLLWSRARPKTPG